MTEPSNPDAASPRESAASLRIHASCVIVGEGAVLVRGAAGAGKTGLCLALMAAARAAGLFTCLVADDRVALSEWHGRLVASSPPRLAGLLERRGLGLVPSPHESPACIRLVVDLLEELPPRLPEPADLVTELAGVTLPRLPAPAAAVAPLAQTAAAVLAALALFGDESWAGRA
jgi:serine kinase of HPr protein (carbohydrate metabolism regulator)